MSRKKKTKGSKKTTEPKLRKHSYPDITDPCFSCQNLTLISGGMECTLGAKAFWNEYQGWEINPKDESLPGDICLLFKILPIKKKKRLK